MRCVTDIDIHPSPSFYTQTVHFTIIKLCWVVDKGWFFVNKNYLRVTPFYHVFEIYKFDFVVWITTIFYEVLCNVFVISVLYESVVSLWFRIGDNSWWKIPLIDFILFHILVMDVLKLTVLMYFCLNSVLLFLWI